MSKPLGPNPLAHIIKRQQGITKYDFRINLFRERLKIAKNLYKKDLISHFGCVNAIEFSREGEFLVSGGDDRRVLLWHIEKSIAEKEIPRSMDKQHQSNIFCLGFNSDNSHIFSGGNDDTVIVHDTKTGDVVDVFLHDKPVYGLSIDPLNDQIFSTAGEDGRVLVFDLRLCAEVMCIAKYRAPFHAVMFHPMDGGFLVTANAKEGAGLWDLRRPKNPVIRYGGESAAQNCMSVRFNTLGSSILALRRRLPPILYSTFSETPICQFYHPDYYNSCTMKSCCFAGEMDEYVLSGSDDFNLYVWRIEDADYNKTEQWIDSNQMVLYGHRSIVNQVRYNPQKCMIASSGVEKVIKLWTPFSFDGWNGNLTEETTWQENQRLVYSHDEYLSLMNISIQNMTHDYANQNTTEDPRMMAFFDSLVQQEIEAWNSSNDSESDQSTEHTSDNSSRPTSIQSSDENESINNFITIRETNRGIGGGSSRYKPQRTKYPNRIAYLIATKRNTLKRLAMKGSTHRSSKIKSSSKYGNRKVKRNNLRNIRKVNNKRNGRYVSKKSLKRCTHKPISDTEIINKKTTTKRRITQHLNTSAYHRSYRHRKTKNNINHNFNTTTTTTVRRTLNTQMSSFDDDDDDDDDDTVPKNRNRYLYNENNIESGSTSVNLAVPSTSTGITEHNSSNMLFRLTEAQVDSDDDLSTNNSPVNHYQIITVNGNKTNNTRHNNNDIYSSHSNSRLSNSSYQDDGTSDDSLNEYFTKRKKNDSDDEVNSNDEDDILNIPTPQKTRNLFNSTPDSGIATAPCSSSGSVNNIQNDVMGSKVSHTTPNDVTNGNENGECSSLGLKIFNQKISRVRRNYRKKFADDSESD